MAIIKGTANKDQLLGTADADELFGYDGDDILDGGAGLDIIRGGAGRDTVSYASATEGVVVRLALQNDVQPFAGGRQQLNPDQLYSIENITGSAFNDVLFGNGGSNKINGGEGDDVLASRERLVSFIPDGQPLIGGLEFAVDAIDTGFEIDWLSGGIGNDYLIGGIRDNLDGGLGVDRIWLTLASAKSAIVADLTAAFAGGSATVAGGSVSRVEEVYKINLSQFDDVVTLGDAGQFLIPAAISGAGNPLFGDAGLFGGVGKDVVVGGAGMNILWGEEGDDQLSGLGGNDYLIGGFGLDQLDGGDGDDVLIAGDFDLATEFTETVHKSITHTDEPFSGDILIGGAGDDSLWAGIGDTARGGTGEDRLFLDVDYDSPSASLINAATLASTGTVIDGIEHIWFHLAPRNSIIDFSTGLPDGVQDIAVLGSSGNDRITGADGDDDLSGGDGNDWLGGGAGNDRLTGGDGVDTVDYSAAATGIHLSLTMELQDTVGAGIDAIEGIENVIGSAFEDELTGSAANNRLEGGAGDDILIGLGGDDTLHGGLGNDFVASGLGKDYLIGDTGIDTVDFRSVSVTSGVSIDLAVSTWQNSGAFGEDRIVGFENINGTDFADVLKGNFAANVLLGFDGSDQLFGAGGADTLEGGAGDDLLDGGADWDIASYASAAAGVTVSLALQAEYGFAAAQETIGAGWDRLSGIERLIGSGFNDALGGSIKDDRLDGHDGADTISGNAGADRLYGEAGDDRLAGGAGNDTIDGAEGCDTADYSGAAAGVTVDLGIAYVQDTISDGSDLLISIENLVGSAFADTLTGTTDANRFEGGAGGDIISGLAGDDTLLGGAGDDTLNGNLGADHLEGEAGNDKLFGGTEADILVGGDGDDLLVGGQGADSLHGGAGADIFRLLQASESTAGGGDQISDFNHAEGDLIDLSKLDASSTTALDNAFKLVAAFTSVAGQLVASRDAASGSALVRGDTNGDGLADFAFAVTTGSPLVAADFIL